MLDYAVSAPPQKQIPAGGWPNNKSVPGWSDSADGAGLSSVIESIYNRKEVMSESLGIAVTNSCYQCQALDSLCPDCDDLKFSRDTYIAHEIVDDGNLQYKHVWSNGDSTVSGHDWVGSVTKLLRPFRTVDGTIVDERYEFLPPISNLVDRLPNDLETSVTVLDYEVVCMSCHLYHHKSLAECPICY
jgi:hypothetical protein